MGVSDIGTKHIITSLIVKIHKDRAIAETNAIIVAQKVARHCIYDMSSFDFPGGMAELDAATIQRYPREYAPLAYVLEKSGFPVARVFPTIGSKQENLKISAQASLTG